MMSATVKLFIMLNVGAFVSATLKPIPVKGNYRVEQSLEKWSQDGDKMVISSKRFSIFDVTSRMDDSGCIACKNIVTELAQRVDKNLSEQEIRAGLAQMCTYLPTAKCTSFVETYEGPIVDFFLHKVDPTKICSEIGACKPLDIIPPPKPRNIESRNGLPIVKWWGTLGNSANCQERRDIGVYDCGCRSGYCWANCYFGWCYTTWSYSQSYSYVTCLSHSDCQVNWKCAGSCTI
ncbi:uncharacterized protein LOC110861214 [Folsomia candida]|uniref:uncharacterized protein LOC110861214 n=1 Tax=Folsomia candida TaxID=158441 RepID=UPI000B90070D|nr:uncharacterized protein LOC110861214 [Folsomia candida]